MNKMKKLVAALFLAMISTSAFAITNAQVFAYAEGNYASLFSGTATSGQFAMYDYRYYSATGNYLAVDTKGTIYIAGTVAGGGLAPVGTVASFANLITAWQATVPAVAVGTQMGGARQGAPLNLTGTVSTFTSFNNSGGETFAGITTDGTNLYVTESNRNKILKIVIATGAVSTLAGSGSTGQADGTGGGATFWAPSSITTDGSNLYVTDGDNSIRKIVIATGQVTTMKKPPFPFSGITADGSNLYSVSNLSVLQVALATGQETSRALSITLSSPRVLSTDGTNLYVSDVNRIYKIVIATGATTVLAGTSTAMGNSGFWDGIGVSASFKNLQWGTTDGTNLYVTDANNNIRKIVIASGVVTTLAGPNADICTASAFGSCPSGNTNGTGTAARFWGPAGITSDGASLYVMDANYGTIRRIQ